MLIKHRKPNEFLDSSGCLVFISVCFMFVLWFTFSLFIYSVPTIAQLLHTLVRSVNNDKRLGLTAKADQPESCKRY